MKTLIHPVIIRNIGIIVLYHSLGLNLKVVVKIREEVTINLTKVYIKFKLVIFYLSSKVLILCFKFSLLISYVIFLLILFILCIGRENKYFLKNVKSKCNKVNLCNL